jgi:hypothetical protein
MPTIRHYKTSLLTSLLLLLSTGITFAQQMNYQGRLTDSLGNAVGDAQYFIAFDIYDAPTGGNDVWGPETNAADTVQGRFNVILGPTDAASRNILNAFNGGTTRYLQITFQGNPILPRQQILAAPVSFRAMVADTVTNGSIGTAQLADGSVTAAKINGGTGVWTGSGTNIYHLGGFVGINTSTPMNTLQVNGGISARDTTGTNGYVAMWLGSAGNAGWLEWWRPGPLRLAYLGYSTGGINNLGLNLENSASFNITGGNVGIGIGTATPGASLDVGGSIRAGTTITAGGNITANTKVVTVGDEALRIVRGTLDAAGNIVTGSGFNVSHTASSGQYTINFFTAFAGTPTVTANPAPGLGGISFCQVNTISASSVTIEVRGVNSGYFDEPIGFIAVGPR